jgi:ABC-type Fe3+ transport system permease subunit
MIQIFVILLLVTFVALFGLASISQSYATSKQAQAAIEASRAAQIASTGNLVAIVTMAMLAVAFLAAVVVIAWLVLRAKSQPKRQWTRTDNGGWDQFDLLSKSQPQANALIPALMAQLLYEMTQHQQQDAEQFWMSDPAMNDTMNDVPSFPDNTWDM